LADIAETCCSEERIGHCVSHRISIAMTDQTTLARKLTTTKNQLAFRVVTKSVNIKTLTHPNLR
jgi:hypothetical protein